ncbi:phosphopentomutase [Heliorestis convoluta]|uniref:Phosphopentomutase n=1 Tax=Heliorestis convoluta TaxID=356322 RepID=A0A5Q2MW09_9FIRM|nr:phosphopentomutase [Heliorestis convoluta]QGG46524.1 phosphopentomutase [Heliorestis convoluta]
MILPNSNKRAIIIVLDSVGIGAMPDAHLYGDEGTNTLGNVASAVGGLNLPTLGQLGLGNIGPIEGVPAVDKPLAAYGKMAEKAPGKDTTTGHWELGGVILDRPFPTYPQGFPSTLIKAYEKAIGRKILGNVVASGTEIIARLGQEHVETGFPIVYTSADSVFQIAAHEEVISLADLYRYCEIAREMLRGEHAVGRVIARPFVGTSGSFQRTVHRKDYSLLPPRPLIFDTVKRASMDVVAIGKIKDIYAGQGITAYESSTSNREGMEKTIEMMKKVKQGLIMTNLVDFDMLYGHRNDPKGYAQALQEFDQQLPDLLKALRDDDLLILTADHGCDPTTVSTDHSREYVPVLLYGPTVEGQSVGIRKTFADVGETVLTWLGLPSHEVGEPMIVWKVR